MNISIFRFLHRRNARAFCLIVFGLTRLIIHQPLAFRALQRVSGALSIFDAKAIASVACANARALRAGKIGLDDARSRIRRDWRHARAGCNAGR